MLEIRKKAKRMLWQRKKDVRGFLCHPGSFNAMARKKLCRVAPVIPNYLMPQIAQKVSENLKAEGIQKNFFNQGEVPFISLGLFLLVPLVSNNLFLICFTKRR
jgi:hypothetical protein